MKRSHTYRHLHWTLTGTALVVMFFISLLLFYLNNGYLSLGPMFQQASLRTAFLSLQVIILLYINFYTVVLFDRLFRRKQNSLWRFVTELLTVVLSSFLVLLLVRSLYLVASGESGNPLVMARLQQVQTVSLLVSLLLYAGITGLRFFTAFRHKRLELLRLEKEYTQVQFESLKTQINPTFFFRSLHFLRSLIYRNTEEAEAFIEQLSSIYRYLLEQRNKESVSVQEEILFLNAYQSVFNQLYDGQLSLEVQTKAEPSRQRAVPYASLLVVESILEETNFTTGHPAVIRCQVREKDMLFTYPIYTTFERLGNGAFQHIQNQFSWTGKTILAERSTIRQEGTIQLPFL